MPTRPSNLKIEEAELIAEYLNATLRPTSEYGWKAGIVTEHDSTDLGINSQDPIITHTAPPLTVRKKGVNLEKLMADIKIITDFFKEKFQGEYYYQKDQSKFYLKDVDLLGKLKAEAQTWKLGKSSKPSFFGKSEMSDVKDNVAKIDINQLVMDLTLLISQINNEAKKEMKPELSATDLIDTVGILNKIRMGNEKDLSADEVKQFNEFKKKVAISGADKNIIDRLNGLDKYMPKPSPSQSNIT